MKLEVNKHLQLLIIAPKTRWTVEQPLNRTCTKKNSICLKWVQIMRTHLLFSNSNEFKHSEWGYIQCLTCSISNLISVLMLIIWTRWPLFLVITCIHHQQCISKEQAILKQTKLNSTSNSNRDISNSSFPSKTALWIQTKTNKWKYKTFLKLLVLTLQEKDNLKTTSNKTAHKISLQMLHQIEINMDFEEKYLYLNQRYVIIIMTSF